MGALSICNMLNWMSIVGKGELYKGWQLADGAAEVNYGNKKGFGKSS